MERIWTFGRAAVTATLVDFADPALVGRPDVRERGVRIEVRPARWSTTGSIYSSPSLVLDAAVAAERETVVGEVEQLLARAREPWPDVVHDERGLVAG